LEWGVRSHARGKTVWARLRLGGNGTYGQFDVDAVEAL
jgi:hypothetical protein